MFKFILCDEFQDTSKAQLTLLKVLARGGNLSSSKATSKSSTKRNIATAPTSSRVPNAPTHQCRVLVCGDDDQCIYGWRAGTINAFQVGINLVVCAFFEMTERSFHYVHEYIETSQRVERVF